MRERLERLLWIGSGIVLAISVVSVLVFIIGTLASRAPYWGEAEVLFEASRIRSGYPLFIDPIVGGGATEYGEPPSRFFVTYPPILSLAIAAIPSSGAMIVGRILASLAWFGSLAWIVRSSSKENRANAIAAATFIAGIWVIANFAATARPDSFACACAAFGLHRAVKKKEIDLLSLCLLILAAWLKPTLLGLPAGAIIANKNLRLALIAIAIVAVTFLLFHFATGGKLLTHVMASNAQPFSLSIWIERITHHLPFFGPLFVIAIVHGSRSREKIALGAMIGALAWVVLAIAKTGSSANYWMEPCIAALVLIAHTPASSFSFSFGKSGLVHAAITLGVVLYADVAAITSSFGQMNHYRREAAFLTKVRSQCDSGAIASDEQGLELALNNRIIIPAYQMSWLVHEGKFPSAIYIDTITAPQVKCFLIHKTNSPIAAPEIQTAVEAHFPVVVSEDDGLRLLSIR